MIKWKYQVAAPQYILNVGDNFYLGGIENQPCGSSSVATQVTKDIFQRFWKNVFVELTYVPWFSVLGNHDYGGRHFMSGWDQQMFYSYIEKNWVMP